ncbi:MAG: hypothetical protein QMC96_10005 [Methanomicrobiales archaeon]|nr:hypothetical protein [Methanomicrobiales archaeon]
METYLADYMARIRASLRDLDRDAAHEIAMVVLTYKMGVYDDTVRRCDLARSALAGQVPWRDLTRALEIVRTRAGDLQSAGTISTPLPGFEPEEKSRLPLQLADTDVDDASNLHLVNALVLLYAAGRIASQRDEQALEEQEHFPVQLLEGYKKFLE